MGRDRHSRRWWWLAGALLLALAAGPAVVTLAFRNEGDGGGGGGGDEPRAVVWAVGDGADGGGAARRVAARIGEEPLDRFLYLGDVYESGTAKEFRRNYAPVYGRFARFTSPTPGNHEWPLHREGYDRYWRDVNGRPQPDHYSLRLGGWQVLSLNSEAPHGPRSRQVRWLRRQVAGPGTCRLAFWHSPRYSAGTVHGDRPDLEPFWEALRGRASLIVTGHDHNMQRLRPRDGITQLISGAGGHGHYSLNRADERLAFGNDTDYGALRLELRPGAATFRFVALDGRVLDSGRVACRP